MIELLQSNDPVLISYVVSILEDAKIDHLVADRHMSVIDGSIGAIQNRVFVTDEQALAARDLLVDAGVEVST